MSCYELRLAKIQYCNPTTCLLPGTPLCSSFSSSVHDTRLVAAGRLIDRHLSRV